MQALSCSKYRFDNFELDVVRRRLLRNGRSVTLNPKAFDMLRVLVMEALEARKLIPSRNQLGKKETR